MRGFIITWAALTVLGTAWVGYAQETPAPLASPAGSPPNGRRVDFVDAVAGLVSESDVEKCLREFVGLESRVLGYPGNPRAADLVIRRLEELGFERIDFDPWEKGSEGGKGDRSRLPVGPEGAAHKRLLSPFPKKTIPDSRILVDEFEAPVPVDRGASLELPDYLEKPLRIYPLWPNLVRTSQLPRSGVSGHLIYVGKGTYPELDAKRVPGSIALMDFNCGRYYINVRDLGARAIVFIEPTDTDFRQSDAKLLEVPVDIPRFWLKREDARGLILRILGDRLKTDLSSSDVLRAKARERGVDLRTKSDFDVMMLLFGRVSNGVEEGSTVPARVNCRMGWERAKGRNIYTVIYGSDPVLRREVIVVEAFYDSMSVVPSLAPGAQSTGGIVGLLELAKVLKQHPPKRSVLLLATGSHFVSWEGIADWVLRHAPRGGTELRESIKSHGAARGAGVITWTVRILSLLLVAGFVAIIVVSTLRIRYWQGRGSGKGDRSRLPVGPEGAAHKRLLSPFPVSPERRASGLASLRFTVAIFLVPVALVALLSNLERTFEYVTPQPLPLDHDAAMAFSFSLDLSSGGPQARLNASGVPTSSLGAFFTCSALYESTFDAPGEAHRVYMGQYARRLAEAARGMKFNDKLAVQVEDCVEPVGRLPNDFVPRRSFLLDGTVILRTGNPALGLMTIEDLRARVDTPLDDAEEGRVNFVNLTAQVRAACSLILHAANDPVFLKQVTGKVIRDRVKRLTTRVVEANYRESFVADTPVVDGLVVYQQTAGIARQRPTVSGVRDIRIAMTDEKGLAADRFVVASGPTHISPHKVMVRAYKLSPDDGRIIYAPDRGEEGDKSYPLEFNVSHPSTQHQLVVFGCDPLDLYQVDNARYLRAVGSGAQAFAPPTVFDVNDAAPQEFGFDFPTIQDIKTGDTEDMGVVYVKTAPPGTEPNRVKVIMGSTVFGVEYLLTNTQEAVLKGVTGEELYKGAAFAAPPDYTVFNSGLQVARDMIRIDDWRMKRFETYGVVKKFDPKAGPENERLAVIHHSATSHLDAAEKALAEHRYSEFRVNLDKALGYETRAYPDVKGTANDTVRAFMFYCLLLLPFAFFCERLFFGFPDIKKQLFGFAAFFLLIFGVMAVVHPVFRITDAPYVILLAFVILVLAVAVLAIIIAKFNEQMARMRRKAAKVHEADVGRLSATGAAVLLGISNMKKRKVRTTLTTVTLILLTFTVMSFTSVRTETVYSEVPQSYQAAYTGLLLRDRMWFAIEPVGLDQFRRHFEPQGKVIPRAWMSSTDAESMENYNFVIYRAAEGRTGRTGEQDPAGGAAETPKGVSSSPDRLVASSPAPPPAAAQVDCRGVAGFLPEETRALNFGSILVAGRWFEKPDEPSTVLSSHVAFDLLGFTAADVTSGNAHVRMRGTDLQVVGVVDSARLEQLRDLDEESYTPLDMATKSDFGQGLTSGQFSQNIVEVRKLPHISVESTALVPYDVCRRMGGRITSAAVVFPEGADFEPDLKAFLARVGLTVFMGVEGRVKAYSSIALSSVGEVGNLFVPILIAALIVLNTMMGSVHERAHEIGIYSSVGLAPVHIAALFLAESCVYAVMGAISGYLLGTVAGKLVSLLNLAGLTLNYSSLAAVFSTVVVMGTVILSTLYPAKMAANMSVPDVTRRWKFPEPTGDVWRFDFPFTVATKGVLGLFVFLDNYFDGYKEESIGSFYADHIRFYSVKDTYGVGYVVEMDCWLAPFDLSVSQNVQLRALPTEDEGVTRIEMCITRKSGEVTSWQRLNRGFLTLMRKQFLIWRTVASEVKEEYGREGEARMKRLEA